MELTLGISKIWDRQREGFPGGPVVPCLLVQEIMCLIPGLERSPGEENGNPPTYACLENSVDRGPDALQSMGLQKESDMVEVTEPTRMHE